MIEHCRKLIPMPAFHREEIGISFAAGCGLIFHRPDERRKKPNLVEQAAELSAVLSFDIPE